jgi:hypothetical protein
MKIEMVKLAKEIKEAAEELDNIGRFDEATVLDGIHKTIVAQNAPSSIEQSVSEKMKPQTAPVQQGAAPAAASTEVQNILAKLGDIYKAAIEVEQALFNLQKSGGSQIFSLSEIKNIADKIKTAVTTANDKITGGDKGKGQGSADESAAVESI